MTPSDLSKDLKGNPGTTGWEPQVYGQVECFTKLDGRETCHFKSWILALFELISQNVKSGALAQIYSAYPP